MLARKSRLDKIKNENIKEIMGVKGNPNIIDIIEKKRLQWYGHVKRMSEERIPKLIMEWVPAVGRERGRPRKTWMEGVQAAMTARNLQQDQWRNREEWRLVCGRRRQLSQNWIDRLIDITITSTVAQQQTMGHKQSTGHNRYWLQPHHHHHHHHHHPVFIVFVLCYPEVFLCFFLSCKANARV
jgi:hypothetical protein